jgi:hypothetical protein
MTCDAVRSIRTDLDAALEACDTGQVMALLDEIEALIGVEAVQPLLRTIITRAVDVIGIVLHAHPALPLN